MVGTASNVAPTAEPKAANPLPLLADLVVGVPPKASAQPYIKEL